MLSKIKGVLKRIVKGNNVKVPVYIPVIYGESLKGRSVFITGGNGGIGYAIALACLRNGADVVIAGRNKEKLEKAKSSLAKELDRKDAFIGTLSVDMANVSDFEGKVSEAAKMFPSGKTDALVNCAGIQAGGSFGNTVESGFDDTINTNLKGTYFMSEVFSKYMISNEIKGNILNISSVSGIRPSVSAYMISKRGINGLTEGMAKRLIKSDIVVNGIAPGPTATAMLNLDGENLEYEKAPAHRYSSPVEVANLAVFLISDFGRMIVGETICLSGGCGNLTYDDIGY